MLGATIRLLRRQRDWTQAELAQRAGIHQGHVADIENGRSRNPTQGTLTGLAGAFEMRVEDLLALTTGALPDPLDQLRAQGVSGDALDRLATMWPDLTPEDREAVVELTGRLWARRSRRRPKPAVGPERVAET